MSSGTVSWSAGGTPQLSAEAAMTGKNTSFPWGMVHVRVAAPPKVPAR